MIAFSRVFDPGMRFSPSRPFVALISLVVALLAGLVSASPAGASRQPPGPIFNYDIASPHALRVTSPQRLGAGASGVSPK